MSFMLTLTALLLVTHLVYVVSFVLLHPLGVLIASLAVNVNVNVPFVHAASDMLHVGTAVSTTNDLTLVQSLYLHKLSCSLTLQ